MTGMHFERMAAEYAAARPPYPGAVFETLRSANVIGPGIRVLEIGAGAGLATRELTRQGSEVVALEPGTKLAALMREAVPGVAVVPERLEDAELPDGSFDSTVAATSLHWVDLSVGLPKIHAALRPDGRLGVWRTIFGDDGVETEFRVRVAQVAAERDRAGGTARRSREGPTMEELADGGWFEPVRTERWRWSTDLSTDQVRRLFRTFSDWSGPEVDAVGQAVADLGGTVTGHYQSVLHLLRRAPSGPDRGERP